MSRIRIAFRQEGPARFVSHLDIVRAFERAARRAGLQPAYTQGFNPRPKMAFAAPLPVGMSGAQELVDIVFERDVSPQEVKTGLEGQMPGGLVILKARAVADGAGALMGRLDRAVYTARGRLDESLTPDELNDRVRTLLNQGEVFVERKTGKGIRRRDIRPGIRGLTGRVRGEQIEFLMELQSGSRGNVRPDEVLTALTSVIALDPYNFFVCRTAMLADDGRLLWDC